jgi:predicted DNA-binding transcriptional regulator AlpA
MNKAELPSYDFNFVDEAGACQLVGGEATPIHRSTLWRMIRENGFPQPFKPTPGTCRWKVSEIAAYLEKASTARATNKTRPAVLAMNAARRGSGKSAKAAKPAAKRKAG